MLSGGTLALGSDSASGSGAINLNVAGGTFRSADMTPRTLANAITLSHSTLFGSGVTGNLVFNGATNSGSVAKALTINNAVTTFNGVISGTGTNVNSKAGEGTLIFGNGANDYTKGTTVNAGVLRAGTPGQAFGVNSAVTLADVASATLDLADFNNSIGSLSGGGPLGGNVTSGSAIITVGGANTSPAAYAGIISGTGGALTKVGSGTLSLTNANSYTGATSISAGILEIEGAGGALSSTSSVAVNGGTLLLSGTASDRINNLATFTMGGGAAEAKLLLSGTINETVGALTLSSGTGSRVIDFGTTSGGLTFSSIGSNASAVPLQFWNWSGNLGSGGGTDQLISTGGLGANTSLSDITFFSDSGSPAGNLGTATFASGSAGELVPVPEPGALIGALGLLAPLAWRERRHWLRCREARA